MGQVLALNGESCLQAPWLSFFLKCFLELTL